MLGVQLLYNPALNIFIGCGGKETGEWSATLKVPNGSHASGFRQLPLAAVLCWLQHDLAYSIMTWHVSVVMAWYTPGQS